MKDYIYRIFSNKFQLKNISEGHVNISQTRIAKVPNS